LLSQGEIFQDQGVPWDEQRSNRPENQLKSEEHRGTI
jgi:hypothetical protein